MRFMLVPGGGNPSELYPEYVEIHGDYSDSSKLTTLSASTTISEDYDTGAAISVTATTTAVFTGYFDTMSDIEYADNSPVQGYPRKLLPASAYITGATPASLRFASASWNVGDTVVIKAMGFNKNSRDTLFASNGVSATHTNGADIASCGPAASITTVTTDDGSGNAVIDVTVVRATSGDVAGYWSFFDVTVTAATTPGIPATTLSVEGVLQVSKTGIQRRITAGANLNGVQRHYATDVTTDASGFMPALDLSATALSVGDTVRDTVLLSSGETIGPLRTVEDIS
ncbi:hypothetical protein [Marinobacter sp. BGYM27]|uniref:hypothetical protein n=1 Tax=Marinobacter sp. BGYM27 TaxID=2975597 RepID=UPI0021A90BA8|nr:hypothetical protein [Marinobacter sp. BGYM27]MDG5498955.1 hypothetical protein [Marinobacter sp. BGYM27]